MIDRKKNVEFWDQAAQRAGSASDGLAGLLSRGRRFHAIERARAEHAHFLRIYTPDRSARVLEVGCGGGRWGFLLANKVESYVGIDISPRMIEVALAERECRGLANVRFECTTLPEFRDNGGFDLIYFSSVLQYMDDTEATHCIARAASMLTGRGIIISRDSVQVVERVEKNGEYPVIYRKADEYRAFFRDQGFVRTYMADSYEHKRFSGIASRLYELPGVTFGMAYTFRELLCRLDAAMGSPELLKTRRYKLESGKANPQRHVFSKYVRKA